MLISIQNWTILSKQRKKPLSYTNVPTVPNLFQGGRHLLCFPCIHWHGEVGFFAADIILCTTRLNGVQSLNASVWMVLKVGTHFPENFWRWMRASKLFL